MVGFKRSRMLKPATTIIFAEEPEDNFPETNGQYDTVQRHFGGSHFVMGDGHAEWVTHDDFCRECPTHPISSGDSSSKGDWKSTEKYHWFPFKNTPT